MEPDYDESGSLARSTGVVQQGSITGTVHVQPGPLRPADRGSMGTSRGTLELVSHTERASFDVLGQSVAKRAFDVVIAALLLIPLAPVMLVLAAAVKLDSAGPVLYRCRRVGLLGRDFEMLKFRKMHRDAAGPPLTSLNDDRLTRLGTFLTRSKLDELPQLLNVIRGDMSLVGPRPEDPAFVAIYPEEYRPVLQAKPGITGLSQLAFAQENRILQRPELAGRYVDRLLPAKLKTDALYIARRSAILDAQILGWTVATVLFGIDVAVDRETCRLSVRRRADETSGSSSEQTAT
jgi:lipopolysaccharide/colanic/teichoic acid biosynthesis glycosyltransferase